MCTSTTHVRRGNMARACARRQFRSISLRRCQRVQLVRTRPTCKLFNFLYVGIADFDRFDSFDTSNLTLRLVKCLKKQKHTLIQIQIPNVRVLTSNTLAGLSAPAAAAAEEEEEAGRSGGRSAAARFNELHLTYCCVLHRHACTTRLLLARVHRELKLSFLHHHALYSAAMKRKKLGLGW